MGISMLKRVLWMASLLLTTGAARADFSIVCDEQAQVEDILKTTREKGFHQAVGKFRAYVALRDERNEPTCEMARVPDRRRVGMVVGHFSDVEFMPAQTHDVLVVEIRVNGRTLFGTLSRFVAEKIPETGL